MISKNQLKAGVHMIGVKFEVILKRKLLGFKWVGNTTRQLISQREPQVGRGLFEVPLLIFHVTSNFNFLNTSNRQHFLNLSYPLSKNISFPKCPKI